MTNKKAAVIGGSAGAGMALGMVALIMAGMPAIGISVPLIGFALIGYWPYKQGRSK